MDDVVYTDLTSGTGDELVRALSALASPHRLRILAALGEGRRYVSELARQVGISRPLLRVHLNRLETAGLVRGSLEVSEDGKAMRYFEVVPFVLNLNLEQVEASVRTLTLKSVGGDEVDKTGDKTGDTDGNTDGRRSD
ncbi:ArsR family transcriptional regulator [Actinomadura spongiicola]|uniref:ArsR family transcriptional regulator n=1 Tax=Actinomadura spongiicola TaxID=2303421 RepID=A0A372GQE1_9ACTN|nr:winged helix-turn-helix domain-containing protein [Actinomadura spongiicola]RFS87313.1 ArsR family transcriptional regulator [Actinomadura spongiicola]